MTAKDRIEEHIIPFYRDNRTPTILLHPSLVSTSPLLFISVHNVMSTQLDEKIPVRTGAIHTELTATSNM
jgi:hypothetical protein